jgi:Zn-dependent protease with chaperone function
MDFFYKQDQTRRKTWQLIIYFMIAITGVVIVINVSVFLLFNLTHDPANRINFMIWLSTDKSVAVSATTIFIILLGTAYRTIDLMDGGIAVANMAGATLLAYNQLRPEEKIFVNVVEEMAIASGVPVPGLYVMETEAGINAFVAGFRPTETVMVVTRGALDQLSRDELQGVVGHEFSHILNGDMRINLRLIAILEGLLLLGKVGEFYLRAAKNSEGPFGVLLVAGGLVLYVAGYSGLFFGRVIKSAISRQREYLADASSVQFTRNTKGLAGALYKIKTSDCGSHLNGLHAEDLSHLCIGSVLKVNSWLATHPPLDARIHALDPAYISTQRAIKIIEKRDASVQPKEAPSVTQVASRLSESIGNITAPQLELARQIHADLPVSLMQSMHSVEDASCVVYALLSAQNMPADIQKKITSISKITDNLDRRLRLPIIDMVLPQLKRMPSAQQHAFVKQLEKIIMGDNRYTFNEFVMLTIIKQHLSRKAGSADVIRYHSFRPLLEDVQLLLSMIATCSGQSPQRKHDVYQRSIKVFTSVELPMHVKPVRPSQISESLEKIRQASMWLRKGFIEVCLDMIMEDGIIMPAEAELLRAVCESIDCPMPLLAAA